MLARPFPQCYSRIRSAAAERRSLSGMDLAGGRYQLDARGATNAGADDAGVGGADPVAFASESCSDRRSIRQHAIKARNA
jgi:hypothetical protein